jgi:hypothetical protein
MTGHLPGFGSVFASTVISHFIDVGQLLAIDNDLADVRLRGAACATGTQQAARVG